jgi:RHS repeat-associated protein
LGSVVALSGNSGTLSDSYTYTAFGDLRSTTGTSTQPYRYLGNAYDSSSKLYDFHARAYDSSVGRFTSEDPINGSAVMPQTLNPYVYGLNGPLAYTDAGGRQAAPVLQGSALYVAYSAPVVLPAVAAGIEAVGVGAVVLTAGSGLILVGAAVVVVGGLYALSQPMNQQSAQAGQAAEPINPLTDQSQSESTVDKDCQVICRTSTWIRTASLYLPARRGCVKALGKLGFLNRQRPKGDHSMEQLTNYRTELGCA